MSTQISPLRPSVWLRVATLALVLGSLSLGACKAGGGDAAAKDAAADKSDKKDGKTDQKTEAVPVEVASVSRQPISASYSGTASLDAPNEAQVVAKTSGVMVQQLAEEGDVVHAGQVLARIDPEQTRLEAQRQLAAIPFVCALEHRLTTCESRLGAPLHIRDFAAEELEPSGHFAHRFDRILVLLTRLTDGLADTLGTGKCPGHH